MEDFKQYLNEDADEQERAAANQVEQGLANLRIEKKVELAAAERKRWLRLRLFQRVVTGAVLLAITGGGYWYYAKKESYTNHPPESTMPTDKPIDQKQDSVNADLPKPPPAQRPMAQRPDLPNDPDKPILRGVSPDQDSATMALVKNLLRITLSNDPVYGEAHFDKRHEWGKIVGLLRQNNPAAAKKEIFSAGAVDDNHTKEWQWLLGIALLEEGKHDEAQEIFSRIARDPQHHRQKAAAMAVEALR